MGHTRIRTLLKKAALLVAFPALLGASHASAITLLDTFPRSGDQQGSVSVFSFHEWQAVAIPFHVPSAGWITGIETGIRWWGGDYPLYVGIASGNLIGRPPLDTVFGRTFCSPVPGDLIPGGHCVFGGLMGLWEFPTVILPLGDRFAWTGQFDIAAGDYWLYADIAGDYAFGSWDTNESLPTGDWATRGCNGQNMEVGCSEWASVSQRGPYGLPGGSYGTPIARIFFEPVPLPGTLALLGLGLAGLGLARRRKQ